MACVLCGIDSTWTHRPCRIDISQIRYHIALVLCEIESTYVKSNLRIFDMTWAAKIDSTVKSILAAPDLPNANIAIRPPPKSPSDAAKILNVFIPSWRIGQCSCTGATLAHATEWPNFYPGCSLSKISCVAHNMVQRYFTFFSAAATIVTPPSSNLVDSPPPRARPFPQRLSEGARGL